VNGDVVHIDPTGGRKTVALLVVFDRPIDEDVAEGLIWEVEDALKEAISEDGNLEVVVEHFNMPRVGKLITDHATILVALPEMPDAKDDPDE